MIAIISYFAIFVLATSYWFQIYKTHIHKEVRDTSLVYHIFLAFGFGVLIFTAVSEGSTIFFVKQVITFVPVLIIIAQILFHRKDKWHDEEDPYCVECSKELEPDWKFCPWCSNTRKKRKIVGCANYRMIMK